MTTTQYIGARYVPLFATPLDWDINSAYDALTIVYYAGNSYTSRQAVPSGVQITNEDYWALTGNYNAQIEQYRKEVKVFDERITTADTTANNALDLAKTNEQDIATLDSELAGTANSGLKTLIVAETSRATNVENTLADNINDNGKIINNEIARATAAEKINADNITAETNRATAAEKINADNITAETNRASAAEKINADAIAKVNSYVDGKFPVASENIADGSITATKLNPTAINSIWQGLEIKRFDINDSSADNEGLIASNTATAFDGFYIPSLAILVIQNWADDNAGSYCKVTLPNYVPKVTWSGSLNLTLTKTGAIIYNSSDYFHDWTAVSFAIGDRGTNIIGLNSAFPNYKMSAHTIVFYLAPYISANTASASTIASDFANNSGVVENV